jgi:D-glycero-alpha-D-manno-heptose-7-phosphate kinase
MEGRYVSKEQLAKDAIYVERIMLEETGGLQDQIAVSMGGFNKIEFLSNGLYHVSPIPISDKRLEEFQNHLLLFYLNTPRTASDIAKTFVPDIDSKRRQLRISHALVDEGINILCSEQDIRLFGELLHEYWMEKRSLSSVVSNNTIDEIYQKALDNGSLGGKLLGAGGGGFLLLFAEPDKHNKIIEGFSDLLHVPFKFEKTGTTIIFKG